MNPLKQGLKPVSKMLCFQAPQRKVKVVNPLKQGLKPVFYSVPPLHFQPVKVVNPLKQGLKQSSSIL